MSAPANGLRERNKQRRVARILEATRKLLRERPGESPSVERIAAVAEVAPATVFNLIGPREKIWAALGDELLVELELRIDALSDSDPHSRARQIAGATVDIICADADVYRHVLAHWAQSGGLLQLDPTPHLTACLRAAGDQGVLRADLELTKLGEMIATACTGAAHQWSAGLVGDRALRARCDVAVDIAFAAAARPGRSTPDFLSDLKASPRKG
jgi:AcrR family transcriptional regulator